MRFVAPGAGSAHTSWVGGSYPCNSGAPPPQKRSHMDASLPWESLVWDGNADGRFTVTDVGLWLQTLFFLPGDTLIWLSLHYAPEITQFFEVNSAQYGSTFSALLSVFIWLATAVLLLSTSHWLATIDRAVTGIVHNSLTGAVTRTHIAGSAVTDLFARQRQALRRWLRSSDNRLKLSKEELRVLKAHAHVDPSSALALSDLVRATGVPRLQIVGILDRLSELRLLDRRVDPDNNEFGYALTTPGRKFLTTVREV
jgi:DNA-binding MarR family transcriptional regulator